MRSREGLRWCLELLLALALVFEVAACAPTGETHIIQAPEPPPSSVPAGLQDPAQWVFLGLGAQGGAENAATFSPGDIQSSIGPVAKSGVEKSSFHYNNSGRLIWVKRSPTDPNEWDEVFVFEQLPLPIMNQDEMHARIKYLPPTPPPPMFQASNVITPKELLERIEQRVARVCPSLFITSIRVTDKELIYEMSGVCADAGGAQDSIHRYSFDTQLDHVMYGVKSRVMTDKQHDSGLLAVESWDMQTPPSYLRASTTQP